MKKVSAKRIVKANCSTTRLQDFTKYNQAMERIIKNLDVFLEEKRSEFPRFYFISNDELLQLLAHQQDISEVNRHLNKCFDNIK
jgi:dynein heavy chain, axonemal